MYTINYDAKKSKNFLLNYKKESKVSLSTTIFRLVEKTQIIILVRK